MIDYPKLFEDIYNGVLSMIQLMKDFVTWLNSPLITEISFTTKPVNNIGDFFANIFSVSYELLKFIPKMIFDTMETLIGVNLGELTPAYVVLGNGIFILITLKILKAVVPLF